jgi:hypothetical protein
MKPLKEKGQNVLVTRLEERKARDIQRIYPKSRYYPTSRVLTYLTRPVKIIGKGMILIITAGTTDIPVAEDLGLVNLLAVEAAVAPQPGEFHPVRQIAMDLPRQVRHGFAERDLQFCGASSGLLQNIIVQCQRRSHANMMLSHEYDVKESLWCFASKMMRSLNGDRIDTFRHAKQDVTH